MHEEVENEDLDEDGDDDFALLSKTFNKFLKKMGKQSNPTPKGAKASKGINPFNLLNLLIKIKVFNVGNVEDMDIFNPSVPIL